MNKHNPHDGTNDQIKRFQDAARELGCDEDEAAFEDKLRRIAKVKPKPEADADADAMPEDGKHEQR